MSFPTIVQLQTLVSTKPDGVWGPKSQRALLASSPATLKKVQTLLQVEADGIWDAVCQARLNKVRELSLQWFEATASSFADPEDVAAFKRCKRTGKTDLQCFRVGDNGIGQFGLVTAQDHTPMVALHRDDMVRRWGSVEGAAHRTIIVSMPDGKWCSATVEDRMSAPGRIDLNPGCLKLLGRTAPLLVEGARWRWE